MLFLMASIVIGTGIWLGLVGSYGIFDVLIGLAVVLSGWVVARRLADSPTPISAGRVFPIVYYLCRYFALTVIPTALRSSLQVMRFVILPGRQCRPAIIAVELGSLSPDAVFLLSFAITLSPGEQVVDIDVPSGTLFVHVLDAPDPRAFRRKIQRQYERYVKEIMK